ncbi:XRE family transcriptional regulator [Acetonema longum]|uniref:XRE family transcriptional regulator n=1 Tax=Acetonema longum DSM 6540 TaxID=1009370 RepID=F7NKF6_9FIRM|nr:XRE family transcriptional regulator [Acetonema longum]EGO63597.1 XRE family transcriptional regulator [Acetonema longum DSM 6540]
MFVQRLKELRAKKDISQSALATHLGMSQQAIAKWETDKATPDPYMLIKLANFFGVTTDYLLGRSNNPNKSIFQEFAEGTESQSINHSDFVWLPILADVKGGPNGISYAEADIIDWERVEKTTIAGKNCIIYKVRGDSMSPDIKEGDHLIVAEQSSVDNGQLAVLSIGDETMVKQVYRNNGSLFLHSFNQAYPPRIVTGQELEHVCIIGRVLESKKKW